MNVILLSGGAGKRLWPLCGGNSSKQFLKLLKDRQGNPESMLQRMYRGIRHADPHGKIIVSAPASQISQICEQLGEHIQICAEPCRKDTFPAICLAGAYLHDVIRIARDEPVLICPSDLYVGDDFFDVLKELSCHAKSGASDLTLLGIEPEGPSEKYGYIVPSPDAQSREKPNAQSHEKPDAQRHEIRPVSAFHEKPDVHNARILLRSGALWNGGVIACQLEYLLRKSRELLGTDRCKEIYTDYLSLPALSFDYAVTEKETCADVMLYHGIWKDLGTWDTLTEVIKGTDTAAGQTCENTFVINQLDIPVLTVGLKNVVVAVSADGILISDLAQSRKIRPYVDSILEQSRPSERHPRDFFHAAS